MPTIEFGKKDLELLTGKKFSEKELEDALMFVKGEIDGREGNKIKLDVKETNNPELLSVEGIARKLKAGFGIKKGLILPKIKKGKEKCIVDSNLKNLRPFIACCVVKNVSLTEEFLEQLIQLQEKLALTFGRKRKEIGLGLYDADEIAFPLYYKGMKDNEVKFAPLDFNNKMSPLQILEKHEKGREYGHLLNGKLFPILIDSENTVASMPPIINSNDTGRVTTGTKNVFIEATGLNYEQTEIALKVFVLAFLERGFEVESMEIEYGKEKKECPLFKTKKISLDKKLTNERTGIGLNDKEIVDLIERAGMNVKINGNKLDVEYSDLRSDILHAMDVVEDLLISYGYNKIEPLPLRLAVSGSERKDSLYLDKVRDSCVGVGLQEVLTFNLTSKEKQSKKILVEHDKHLVELANPMSAEYTVLRHLLFPGLLEFLSQNRHVEMNHKIFEVGRVVSVDNKKESKVSEFENLCILLKGKVDFNLIKGHLNAVTESLGLTYDLTPNNLPFFKEGFSAELKISNGLKGFIGILNDKVKTNFDVGKEEIALLELNLLESKE